MQSTVFIHLLYATINDGTWNVKCNIDSVPVQCSKVSSPWTQWTASAVDPSRIGFVGEVAKLFVKKITTFVSFQTMKPEFGETWSFKVLSSTASLVFSFGTFKMFPHVAKLCVVDF